MDFFDMDFSKLFLEKHGKEKFNETVKQINTERKEIRGNRYIELIFKIAFLDFFGMTDNEIQALITDTMKYQDMDIRKIKEIHQKSITKIQKNLKDNVKKAKNKNLK